jgi:hypothetical protein
MKKILISFFLLSTAAVLSAQTKSFQLFYITKDYTTQVTPLCEWLRERYEMGRRDHTQCNIFYLANAENPIVVRQNFEKDNSADFDKIMDALVTKSETRIYPQVDVPELLDIFSKNDIVNKTGRKLYQGCELYFMITPTFWNLQYNETIFATLYYALELDSDWAKGYVGINIYHNEDDGLEPDMNAPFGTLYTCENYDFQLLAY